MEYLNRIELQGIIGQIRTRPMMDDRKVTNFSLCTECVESSPLSGMIIKETTWHNIVAWDGANTDPRIHSASKGTAVYVKGRLRMALYTGADGTERKYYEVLASEVKILEETE